MQGGNAQAVGRKNAQAHRRNKMGSLVKGGHAESHDFFESQGRLAEFFQTFIEHYNHHLTMRWLRYDDTYSKVFFDFHRIGKKKTLLKELKVDERTISK